MTHLFIYNTYVIMLYLYYACWFTVLIPFQYICCSLLSRFKNRYQYIPREYNDTFTEILYDFDFTNYVQDNKQIDEALYYSNSHFSLYTTTQTRKLLKEQDIKINDKSLTISISKWPHDPVSSYDYVRKRPTIQSNISHETTSMRRRKTWPTYFPWKIILQNKTTKQRTMHSSVNTLGSSNKKTGMLHPSSHIFPFLKRKYNLNKTSKTKSKPLRTTSKPTQMNILQETNSTLPAFIVNIIQTTVKSSCYSCGLNETVIPIPYCHDIFDADDQRKKRRKENFKVKCIQSEEIKQVKNKFFGPWYRFGCFKRFLDVGPQYTERGCRRKVPMRGKSFASKRLAMLETLLEAEEDGCISSPYASLTPFSRAISIFSVYHVCVCSSKYCNKAINVFEPSRLSLYMTIFVIYLMTL